jgi:hypothetical protein
VVSAAPHILTFRAAQASGEPAFPLDGAAGAVVDVQRAAPRTARRLIWFPEHEAIRMRNFLAFLAATVIVLAGVGWYLDWYKLKFAPTDDGHFKVTIDGDTAKARDDFSKGEKKIEEAINKEKKSDAKAEDKKDDQKLQIKSDAQGVEVKTPKVGFSMPWHTPRE